jgi:hypothetical protein
MPQRFAQAPLEHSGARADLTAPDEILALMAQDLNDLRRESGAVTQPQLVELGWTPTQVKSHFLRAIDRAQNAYCEHHAPDPAVIWSEIARAPWPAEQADFHAACEKFDADMRRLMADFIAAARRLIPHPDANEVA